MTKTKFYMRSLYILLCIFALIRMNSWAQSTDLTEDQISQSYPAFKQGVMLLKHPDTKMVPLQPLNYSPLEAYLKGYGKMTPEVYRAIGERPVKEVSVDYFRSNKSNRVVKQNKESRVCPSIIIRDWDREDLLLFISDVDMLNFETEEYCTFRVDDFDQEGQSNRAVPLGEYIARAQFSIVSPEPYQYYGEGIVFSLVNLTEDNDVIEINANDMIYTVSLNAFLPDGQVFPCIRNYNPNADNPEVTSNFFIIQMYPWFRFSLASSDPYIKFMCSKLPKDIYATSLTHYVNSQGESYANCISLKIDKNIKDDLEYNLPCDRYRSIDASFSLTDSEINSVIQGNATAIFSFLPNDCSYAISQYNFAERSETVTVKYCFNENDFAQDIFSGVRLGILTSYDTQTYSSIVKYGGAQINTPEGDKDFYAHRNYSIYCTEYPEITKLEIPQKYYTKALLTNCTIFPYTNADCIVNNLFASFNVYGPENEYIEGLNGWDYLTSLTLNDVEISFNDIIGTQIKNGDFFTYTFNYDNILVDESIESNTSLTIGMGFSEDYTVDNSAPLINYYQIRNAKGEVVNAINPEEGGYLYVAVNDNSEYNINVYLSSLEEDQVIELLSESPEVTKLGDLFTYNLTGLDLKSGVWYNLNINAYDKNGNFAEEVIGHAVKGTQINGLHTIEAFDGNVSYYDLSGRQVLIPTPGVYIKEIQKEDGSLIRNKVFVK